MQVHRGEGTRAALIGAAERLFAEKGLGGVSVREITRIAGARNESALHYHFGGLEALIKEVFASRYIQIEASRLAWLERNDAAGLGTDLTQLMKAAVGPLMEACREEDGRLYARFVNQLSADPRFDVAEIVRETGMTSVATIRDRVMENLKGLPKATVQSRLRRVFSISIMLMADCAAQIDRGTAMSIEDETDEAALALSGFLQAGNVMAQSMP
jgi:AcrR family transcriptional regulator